MLFGNLDGSHQKSNAYERDSNGSYPQPANLNRQILTCNLNGKPLLPNTVTHAWIKLVRRTGLEGIRLHDAQHSHASLILKARTHPKTVQEKLGHSSVTITLDPYSHVTPGLQEAAAIRFDELVSPKREKEALKKPD